MLFDSSMWRVSIECYFSNGINKADKAVHWLENGRDTIFSTLPVCEMLPQKELMHAESKVKLKGKHLAVVCFF